MLLLLRCIKHVLDHISKHLELYSATRRIFNSLLDVSEYGQTQSFVFDILNYLLLQTGADLSQYPLIWPGLWRQVRVSDPSKRYPLSQLVLHVEPYLLSQSPTRKPFNGGSNVWHRKTKKGTKHITRPLTIITTHCHCYFNFTWYLSIVVRIMLNAWISYNSTCHIASTQYLSRGSIKTIMRPVCDRCP